VTWSHLRYVKKMDVMKKTKTIQNTLYPRT
jgi:hypothetical protein